MGLRGYILRRTAYTVVLVLFVLVLNFVIFQLMPGETEAVARLVSSGRVVDPEQYEKLKEAFGVGEPLPVRFGKYIYSMLTFNLGVSYSSGRPVAAEIGIRLENTLILMVSSTILSIVIGVLLGIFAAHKRGTSFDNGSVTVALTTFSLPTFWLAMVLIFVFALNLQWFPVSGTQPDSWALNPPGNIFTYILGRAQYAALPILVLTLFQYGYFTLITRAQMLEELTQDYVLTARAKGLKERTVLTKHAFKNASLPIVTGSALAIGGILGGAIITETVFAWNGLGYWSWLAIVELNYPVLHAIFYILALSTIFANFAADLFYGVIDPRIKYG